MLLNIDDIIKFGLNTLAINVPMTFQNYTKHFRFHNDQFYSYNEPIAIKCIKDHQLYFMVYGKTAKFNNFYSQTTSQHIGRLVRALDSDEYYNSKWEWIDNEGNTITGNKDKGKPIEEDIECPICYDKFKKGLELRCGHKYCKKCIKTWLKTNNNCPYCKCSVFY